jgi:D-glycero-alpha-D-manno-heptose-7-phosphate kinase
MKEESYKKLENNLLMFYIGDEHSASEILSEQSKNMNNVDKFEAQRKMCKITRELKRELQNNNVDALGRSLHENWLLKKSLASGISNPFIDSVYEKAINNGALGGKLLGAGGAGFMLFYVPNDKQKDVRRALSNLREMEFEMDNSGATIIHFDR